MKASARPAGPGARPFASFAADLAAEAGRAQLHLSADTLSWVEERYPIGETGSVSLAVLRHERREGGYPMWSAALATGGGEATACRSPGPDRTGRASARGCARE